MTIFIALVLAVLTFAFLIYPFFKQRSHISISVEDEQLEELYSVRDTAYSMLKELEFDYQSGVLTEEDYRDLEARYKKKAVSILKSIDDYGSGTGVEEEEIEAQVLELRRGEEIEKQVLELRRGKGRFCSQCGATLQEDARFCSSCGANLSQGGHVD